MPLRCLLDNESVHSFLFSGSEWNALKASYRERALVMPCCNNRAIPKTSSRGTQFFAHTINTGCPYVKEPQELLMARMAIAKAVISSGWDVITEYRDNDAANMSWVIDVYAHKGKTKLAFHIQWSPKGLEEIPSKHEFFTSKGIRGSWFYRLYRNKEYDRGDLFEKKEIPMFGFRITEQSDDFTVPRFSISLVDFVSGMLARELKWGPSSGDLVRAGVLAKKKSCWKCGSVIRVPAAVSIKWNESIAPNLLRFEQDGVPEMIQSLLDEATMAKEKIGAVAHRSSRTAGKSYLANSCYHCDAIQGNFYVSEMFLDLAYMTKLPAPVVEKEIPIHPAVAKRLATWRFRGSGGRSVY
jgi:hypothetical protein